MGIPYGIAINPTYVGTTGYYTLEELQTLQSNGSDILNRCIGNSIITTDNADYYFRTSKDYFTKNNLSAGETIFIYPNGNNDDDQTGIIDIVKKYYSYAFNVENTLEAETNLVTHGLWNEIPYDVYDRRFNICRIDLSSDYDYTDILDTVKHNKGLIVFYVDTSSDKFDMKKVESVVTKLMSDDFDIYKPSIALQKMEYVVEE